MSQLIAARRTGLGEKRARRIRQLHGKFMISNFGERIGEFVDRVVADGDRAVAPGIDRLQAIILRRLLADLDRLHHQPAVSVGAAAAALIQRKCRGDELRFVLRQPLRTVKGESRLLAAGQRQLDGAFGVIAAGLEAQSSRLASTTSRWPSNNIGFAVLKLPAKTATRPPSLG